MRENVPTQRNLINYDKDDLLVVNMTSQTIPSLVNVLVGLPKSGKLITSGPYEYIILI